MAKLDVRVQAAIGMLVWAALVPAARAWIYPEHRDIALAGIAKLPAAERESLQRLWSEARRSMTGHWCENIAAVDQGLKPPCIDFAAWAALAGDHSCSPQHLLRAVVPSDWVLPVATVAAETKATLARSSSRVESLNAIAQSNLALQRADAEYATRAGANNAHFLLARTGGNAAEYLRSSVAEGAPLNAMGLYVQYHLAALAAADELSKVPAGDPTRSDKAGEVVALGGYALHWLEDSYAAGHVVGTWGATPWRKGTHDYYSEFGVDTTDWAGQSIVMFGDANMKPADLERASSAVARSLHELASALASGDPLAASARGFGPGPAAMFAFDACKQERQPTDRGWEGIPRGFLAEFGATPVPGREEGKVNLPRFRDELGPFSAVFASLTGGAAWGGISSSTRGLATIAAGLRFGYGVEGVTGSVGTGLSFVEVGLEMSASQVDNCNQGSSCSGLGSSTLFPRVPARTGVRFGLRVPFWLLPGDMIVLAPVLALASPRTLSNVGVAAASGGFIPYERSFRTGAGIFQIVAGREVQGTLYGYILGGRSVPLVIVPIDNPNPGGPQYGVLALKSLSLGFPVVEWTPFRTFATQVAFGLQLQLGFGVEVPLSRQLEFPTGVPAPDVSTGWNVFLRVQADGRYFFGSREDLQPPKG